MARRMMLLREWQRECALSSGEDELDELGGPSPGGAAAELGVSRQRVHQLLSEGRLDAIYLREHLSAVPHIVMITERSIKRFLASKPGEQVALPLGKGKGKLRRKG